MSTRTGGEKNSIGSWRWKSSWINRRHSRSDVVDEGIAGVLAELVAEGVVEGEGQAAEGAAEEALL